MAPQAAAIRGGRVATQKKQRRQQQPNTQIQRSSTSTAASQQDVKHAVSPEIQQSILNVFTQSFPIVSRPDDFKRIMQEVKGHLYNRDFLSAFGKQEYLDVYASRWSAARALAYADVFTQPNHLTWYKQSQQAPEGPQAWDNTSNREGDDRAPLQEPSAQHSTNSSANVRIVCIGGGAGAELVALAATNRYIHSSFATNKDQSSALASSPVTPDSFHVLAVDIADWSEPIQRISSMLTQPARLSAYASQASHNANRALVDPKLEGQVIATFSQQDILLVSPSSIKEMLQGVALITVMFTLNELFSASLSKTTALLLNLTDAADVGTHLVVVDSPGSYSEIQLGNTTTSQNTPNTKRYPMKWLLDHTLLEVAGNGQHARWSKVEEDDSRWFRIDQKLDLKYGIDLENCRYQIHVFKKLR